MTEPLDMLREILNERDRRYSEAFAATNRVMDKMEETTSRRFETVNEFRGQLSDQARTFIPRPEYDQAHASLVDRVNLLSSGLAAIQGRILALFGGGAVLGGVVAAIISRAIH